MKRKHRPSRRRGHTPAEYFVAAVGLAFLIFVVALLVTSDACHLRLDPEIGIQPASRQPAATPTP